MIKIILLIILVGGGDTVIERQEMLSMADCLDAVEEVKRWQPSALALCGSETIPESDPNAN